MENQYLVLGLLFLCLVIIFGFLYYYYKKLRQAEHFNHELQKHLLVQRQILEDHDKILHQGETEARPVSPPVINPTSIPPIFREAFPPPVESESPSQHSPRGSAMEKVLPLVGSLMGNLFQQDSSSLEEELTDVVRDKIEERKTKEMQDLKKKKLEEEISNELEELHESLEEEEEGRLDETIPVETAS